MGDFKITLSIDELFVGVRVLTQLLSLKSLPHSVVRNMGEIVNQIYDHLHEWDIIASDLHSKYLISVPSGGVYIPATDYVQFKKELVDEILGSCLVENLNEVFTKYEKSFPDTRMIPEDKRQEWEENLKKAGYAFKGDITYAMIELTPIIKNAVEQFTGIEQKAITWLFTEPSVIIRSHIH
jgi:hypothetical protein